MPDTPSEMKKALIDFYLEDASDRLRFQQEFTIAGFRTLILINGAAVIALLTYAGNASNKLLAANLKIAFTGYILGLVAAVFAYLAAYFGQALIMRHSAAVALAEMGVQDLDTAAQGRRERHANGFIALGVVLCILSLLAFVGGSVAAMNSMTFD